MEKELKRIVDIGCGCNKIPGSIGVDIDKNSYADIIHDLNIYPYPIESNSVDEIYAKHIIEHLDNPQDFLCELYRILKVGGTAFVETPHFSSYVAYSEYSHKFFFSYFTFSNLLAHTNFSVAKQEITFYKTFRMFGIKFLANKFPRNYERFWTYIFPVENVKLIAQKK